MTQEMWADLHVHTNCSDGILNPETVVQNAKEAGLSAVGIVDHDTVQGIQPAETAGALYGIEVVPGVELSSQINGKEIHIIGYSFNPDCPKLTNYLELFCRERIKRAGKMIQNLNRIGVHLSMSEVEEKAKGNSIGRPHIAEVLMEKGYVETFQEAFQKFIGYHSEAYEDKYRISPEEAIRLIFECRGLSFLAHPSPMVHEELILNLIKSGLDGVEVVHPYVYPDRRKALEQIAREHHLLVSGGSDCHGGRDGIFTLGRWKIPFSMFEAIREAHEAKWKNR